jgi:hypothetical protein
MAVVEQQFAIRDILKGTDYALTIFTNEEITALRLFDKGGKAYLTCAATDKARLAKPEEIVLTNIVTGLATMRNKMGDAHAQSYRPSKHHAKLAVNAAKTLADFLFETHQHQQRRRETGCK